MMPARIVDEFSRFSCGHLTDTATGEPLKCDDIVLLAGFASVARIDAPCRACGPQKVERLKDGRVPYDKLP